VFARLHDDQIQQNVRAPEHQLNVQAPPSDDDDAPLSFSAGYKVLSTTKTSTKRFKPSKKAKIAVL
jgi:hypothetical protein